MSRRWLELGFLAAVLVLAALLRLPGLDQHGQWDSDQGRDMEVLQAMVQGGQIPLLGPQTFAGTFHHGALYYYLLAPAALVSGADPVAVMTELALLSVVGVAAIWWLGREVAGPVAGAVAGLLAAVSPAGIGEAIVIWNPGPVPLFAAVAFAAAVRALATSRARWWVAAAAGVMAAMQVHVEGAVILVPLLAAWLVDLRRRRRAGQPVAPLVRVGIVAVLVILAGYIPLLVHELTTGFSETRALLAYLGGSGTEGAGIGDRLVMVAVRSLTWPIAGLVTDRVTVSLVTLVITVGLATAAWLLAAGRRGNPGRWPVSWLLGTIAWSVAALSVLAPSLATITPGLPNDHYHAFLDPVVLALIGAGAARLSALRLTRWPKATTEYEAVNANGAAAPGAPAAGAWRLPGLATAILFSAVLTLIAVTAWPPQISPDGGWRLADAAAAHIVQTVDAGWPPDEPRLLVGLPTFKPDDAMRFPLARRGLALQPPVPGEPSGASLPVGVVIIVCDPLFDEVTGARCDSPAEDAWLSDAYPPSSMQLVERFRAGSRRVISIYAPSRLAVVP